MKILIVTSTLKEINSFEKHFVVHKKVNEFFTRYNYKNLEIDIIITGRSIPLMTYNLTKVVSFIGYDLVLNVGLAASYNHLVNLGSVVNVVEEQFADIGMFDNNVFYTVFEKEIINDNAFPFCEGVLKNETSYTFNVIDDLPQVRGVTVNSLQDSPLHVEEIREKFNPDVETMEGAAFFFVCLNENVPFFEIRGIAGYPDIRKAENWNVQLAIKNLGFTVLNIIDELNSL